MKNTKKNGFLKAACLMLTVMSLSSFVLSGTLAKYYSEGTVEKLSLTVAKWDVTVAEEKLTYDGSTLSNLTWTICDENGGGQIEDISGIVPGTWGYVAIPIVNNGDVDAIVKVDGSFTSPTADSKGLSFKTVVMSSDDSTSSYDDLGEETIDSFFGDDGYRLGKGGSSISIYVCYKWEFGDGTNDSDDMNMADARTTLNFTGSITITAEQAPFSE